MYYEVLLVILLSENRKVTLKYMCCTSHYATDYLYVCMYVCLSTRTYTHTEGPQKNVYIFQSTKYLLK